MCNSSFLAKPHLSAPPALLHSSPSSLGLWGHLLAAAGCLCRAISRWHCLLFSLTTSMSIPNTLCRPPQRVKGCPRDSDASPPSRCTYSNVKQWTDWDKEAAPSLLPRQWWWQQFPEGGGGQQEVPTCPATDKIWQAHLFGS